jgi:hypothetical protein
MNSKELKERVQLVVDQLSHYVIADHEIAIEPPLLFWGCPLARYDNQMKGRTFAHTNHLDDVICVSERLGLLNEPYLYGIIAHEFGHLIALHEIGQGHSEKDADDAVWQHTLLKIKYGTPQHIQYLSDEDIAMVKESFNDAYA